MSKNSEKFIKELFDSGLEMDEAGLERLRENIASGNWYPNPGRKAWELDGR